MIHWYDVTWMKVVGTSSFLWLAEVNTPPDISGFEKVGALGMLGVFMWFTLTRLESAIRENSRVTSEITKAIEKLTDHLDNKRD